MSRINLYTPFLEGNIQNINFFNGRILTGQDLQEEQKANRQQRQQLGQALGTGIVSGLTVSLVSSGASGTTPIVKVDQGLAFNGHGQALALPTYVEINLVRSTELNVREAGLFATCTPPTPGAIFTGVGVYILVITPASSFEGRAPAHGLNGNGRAGSCDFAYAVEGVQFRLVYLDLNDDTLVPDELGPDLTAVVGQTDPASLSKLRNILAHLCLGTTEAADFTRDLFRQVTQNPTPILYSVLDKLRDKGHLTGCDVPLALIYWTTAGVQIVDMGSVQRRLFHPSPSTLWPPLASDRRLAEGEAAFLQFQEQIAYLTRSTVSQAELDTIAAGAYFRYLPAVGLLPLTGLRGARGLDLQQFFSNLTVREPVIIEGARVPFLLRMSFAYEPMDLTSGEMMWLYFVRENNEAIINNPASPPQSYLIFSSGYVPYQGDPFYDLNRAQYSNYGPGIAG